MKKEHRKAFLELKDWCRKWDAGLCAKDEVLVINFDRTHYFARYFFDENTRMVSEQPESIAHPIETKSLNDGQTTMGELMEELRGPEGS